MVGLRDRVVGNHGRRWVAEGRDVVAAEAPVAVEEEEGVVAEAVASVVGEEGQHRGREGRLEHDRARREERHPERGLASVQRWALAKRRTVGSSLLL